MNFEVVGGISDIQGIAASGGIRQLAELEEQYGAGRWRKVKGVGRVRLRNGDVHTAELHWYEAHGIGRRRMKIKRLLD